MKSLVLGNNGLMLILALDLIEALENWNIIKIIEGNWNKVSDMYTMADS